MFNATVVALGKFAHSVLIIALIIALVAATVAVLPKARAFAVAFADAPQAAKAYSSELEDLARRFNAGYREEAMGRLLALRRDIAANPMFADSVSTKVNLMSMAHRMDSAAWWWEKPTGWKAEITTW